MIDVAAAERSAAAHSPIRAPTNFRREPDAFWFCLIGTINDSDDNNFKIGTQGELNGATLSGELCLYANDLNRFYGNNFGKLIVSVARIE